MELTKSASLVKHAVQRRRRRITEAFDRVIASESDTNFQEAYDALGVWARELDFVNKHITVDPDHVADACDSYAEIANHLVDKLKWPSEAIKILPQGSSSTQTLIRPADASKFDIDAVCRVDLTKIAARDPIAFFDEVGSALRDWEAEAKKRCWRVQLTGRRYYIEFTPSVPLATVPLSIQENLQYKPATRYKETALAVVDTPTARWKTSNPEGLTQWVSDQAKRPLIRYSIVKEAVLAHDNVTPVPAQEVHLSDTLRVAIRLFKRHRDMAVKRGIIETDLKPISVIIVTLLTQCYEGLADLTTTYRHPVELLLDLALLMPNMIEERDGAYWVANPTVDGENFAERWNGDDGGRRDAFHVWCDQLAADLEGILSLSEPEEIRSRVRTVFGCPGAVSTGPGGGLAPSTPTRSSPAPASRGLA